MGEEERGEEGYDEGVMRCAWSSPLSFSSQWEKGGGGLSDLV